MVGSGSGKEHDPTPAEKSKSKKPRNLPIIGALLEIIQRRSAVRRLDCPFVFHRKAKRIASFRKVFKSAAAAIEMPGLVPHHYAAVGSS
jgi:integrase